MARHGENIRKRKDGRWEGRYRDYNKGKEKCTYRSVYGRSYEEVKKKLVIQKSLSGKSPQKGSRQSLFQNLCMGDSILFTDITEEWLELVRQTKKPSTYVKYSVVYQNHLKGSFHDVLLSEITEAAVAGKLSDSLSDSLLKSIYCVLNQSLKFASRRYFLSVPVLKKPVYKVQNRTVTALTRKEQAKLFPVLYQKTDLFKMAVILCLYTGLRLGELCALKWSDIDWENRILTVNRTVQRLPVKSQGTKTALIETVPKSSYSKREIPLSAAVFKILSYFRNNKKYIFGGDASMEPRKMQRHFKKILKEAELSDKNFHILRHTFVTNCIEEGADVKSLSEMLGHSDVGITLNRYVHPTMNTKRKHIDILSMFYGQIYGWAG